MLNRRATREVSAEAASWIVRWETAMSSARVLEALDAP